MAPARCTRLAALAPLAFAAVWACGSTKSSPDAPGGEAGSGPGASSTGGHAGSSLGGREAGAAPASGSAGTDPGGPAGAGAGGVVLSEGGAGGVVTGSAGEGGACTQHCSSMEAGAFCEQEEVTWVCEPGFDVALFNAQCRDSATALIRYCCPPEFTGECQ